jgi:hypothetical protein
MTFKPKNPFDQEENLQPFFENDKQYLITKKNQYQLFKNYFSQKHSYKQTTFMSRLFKSITTHSTALVIGLIIAGSAVGASAAQLTAPTQYKPSTIIQELFKANKQADKNPYTALIPDEKNDVVKVEECDLAIKYPKTVYGKKIEPLEIDTTAYDPAAKQVAMELNILPEINKPPNERQEIYPIRIECSITNPLRPEYLVNFDNISLDKLREDTGWFVTATTKIKNIYQDKYQRTKAEPLGTYVFELGNKYYLVNTLTTETRDKNQLTQLEGMYANQIQIQFNSLVSSDANTTVKKLDKKVIDTNQAVKTKLKSTVNLEKEINNVEKSKADGFSTGEICGIPNAVIYSTKQSDRSQIPQKLMVITNKKDYQNNKELGTYYDYALNFINKPNDSNIEALTNGFRNPFTISCYGNASTDYGIYLQDLNGLNYPNTEIVKGILTRNFDEYGSDLTIRIYAKKGDDLIYLRKNIDINKDKIYLDLEKKCGNLNYIFPENWTPEMKACHEKEKMEYLTNQITPQKIEEETKEAQRLIDLFAIEKE